MTTPWIEPLAHPTISAGQVHIWRAELARFHPRISEFWPWLSGVEQARADRFAFKADRANYIAARAILRLLLARYLNTEPSAVLLEATPKGKPFVSKSFNTKGITFNLSHSNDLCLMAFGQYCELGIDVEKVRDDLSVIELADRYFAKTEKEALRALPPDLRHLGFFLGWTRKEAYVKARGDGFHIPLSQFEVTLGPEEPPRLASEDSDRWALWSFTPLADFVGALVAEKPEPCLSYWTLGT